MIKKPGLAAIEREWVQRERLAAHWLEHGPRLAAVLGRFMNRSAVLTVIPDDLAEHARDAIAAAEQVPND